MKIYVKSVWEDSESDSMIDYATVAKINKFCSDFKVKLEKTLDIVIGSDACETFWNGIIITYKNIQGINNITEIVIVFRKNGKSYPECMYESSNKLLRIISDIKQINNPELINNMLAAFKRALSSKQVKQPKSSKWPSASKWEDAAEDDDDFENMWQTYLSKPEDEVNEELQIYPEPSIQGDAGGMFIYNEGDKSRSDNGYPWYEGWRAYLNWQYQAAASSKNAEQYKKKYRQHIKELCGI